MSCPWHAADAQLGLAVRVPASVPALAIHGTVGGSVSFGTDSATVGISSPRIEMLVCVLPLPALPFFVPHLSFPLPCYPPSSSIHKSTHLSIQPCGRPVPPSAGRLVWETGAPLSSGQQAVSERASG